MNDDWSMVKRKAEEYKLSGVQWSSFVRGRKYSVLRIADNSITIKKESGGKDVSLTANVVRMACERLRLLSTTRNATLLTRLVAREAAIVFLHPAISWNPTTKMISWEGGSFEIQEKTDAIVIEASDDEIQKLLRQIQVRQNQSHFRKNLLKIYGESCCISQTKVLETLEAAHIDKYSSSGVNDSRNGLLLRSDIHKLFDSGLIVINPINMTVCVSATLKNSEYFIYNGQVLNQRNDGQAPDKKYIERRWNDRCLSIE